MTTEQKLQQFLWMTENQRRDMLVEEAYFCGEKPFTTDILDEIRTLALKETNRRKISTFFVQCPRCRGYHGGKEQPDFLCEKCEYDVHLINFDRNYKK